MPAIDITDLSGLADVTYAEQIRSRQDALRASLQSNADAPDQRAPWTREDIRAQGYIDLQAASDDVRSRGDHRDALLLGRLNGASTTHA